jgi:hypothetical protein
VRNAKALSAKRDSKKSQGHDSNIAGHAPKNGQKVNTNESFSQ